MSERPSKSKAPVLRIVLMAAMAVLFTTRFLIGSRSGSADVLWDLLLGLAIFGVLMFFLLAVPASTARKMAEELRVARPDAVIVGTYWGAGYTDFFLRPGPLMRHARGRGGRILTRRARNRAGPSPGGVLVRVDPLEPRERDPAGRADVPAGQPAQARFQDPRKRHTLPKPLRAPPHRQG